MKLVIFAGGFGTRLSEETINIPKPLVKIGDMPIIWHIMKYYSSFGVKDFIICLGYKGYDLRDFFLNYKKYNQSLSINLKSDKITSSEELEDWNVNLIDTGLTTQTGGRLKKVYEYLKNEKFFFLTYGDGLCDVDINLLKDFHLKGNKLCTLTAIKPKNRFGVIEIDKKNNLVKKFHEKPEDDWVNGGFFVMSPKVINYISSDNMPLEQEPMRILSEDGNLQAFKHNGFWQCMDTLRDKKILEDLWMSGKPPWKTW